MIMMPCHMIGMCAAKTTSRYPKVTLAYRLGLRYMLKAYMLTVSGTINAVVLSECPSN